MTTTAHNARRSLRNAHVVWKQIAALPADGKVRLVGGMEAVHHSRTATRQACIMLHDGDGALRRLQSAAGDWTKPDRVNWNNGNR